MNNSDPRIAYFDSLAARWDEQVPCGRGRAVRMEDHADLLALRAGEDLLEAGCGTGGATAWLVRQVAPGRVTAVDFSPAMIARARRKRIDAEFLCRDVCADEMGQSRFDVVLCFHSFPHFRDQGAALDNLARALKPTGRLVVMHLSGSEQVNRFHAGIDGPVKQDRLPSPGEWDALLARVGLKRAEFIDREDLFFLRAGF